MVNAFVDSSIVVDVLRQHSPAQLWFQQQPLLGITPHVWLEIMDGVFNTAEQKRALKLLQTLTLVYVEHVDFDWAMKQSLKFKLSHSVGMLDCLIASVSFRLQLPLYTTNIKHFKPLLGNLAQKPY